MIIALYVWLFICMISFNKLQQVFLVITKMFSCLFCERLNLAQGHHDNSPFSMFNLQIAILPWTIRGNNKMENMQRLIHLVPKYARTCCMLASY